MDSSCNSDEAPAGLVLIKIFFCFRASRARFNASNCFAVQTYALLGLTLVGTGTLGIVSSMSLFFFPKCPSLKGNVNKKKKDGTHC